MRLLNTLAGLQAGVAATLSIPVQAWAMRNRRQLVHQILNRSPRHLHGQCPIPLVRDQPGTGTPGLPRTGLPSALLSHVSWSKQNGKLRFA
jgi:hypothetical protein